MKYGPQLLAIIAIVLGIYLVYTDLVVSYETQDCVEKCSKQGMAPILTPTKLLPKQFTCHCNTASAAP